MIVHLLKLLWQRKATNGLLIAEVFISFLVLFAVATLIVYSWNNYSRPLGFSYDNVWNIDMDVRQKSDDFWSAEQMESTRQIEIALRSFPEIEAIGGMNFAPYTFNSSTTIFDRGGKQVEWMWGEVTDGVQDVLSIQLAAGRWFDATDNASAYRPIVINRNLARDAFGDEDPVGKLLSRSGIGSDWQVVGVVDDFRKDGELSGPTNYAFLRINLADTTHRPPRNFLVKVRPGTPLALQQEIGETLQRTVKEWSFDVQSMSEMRRQYFNKYLAVLAAGIFVAFNLILMVALGLIGVLWQNVTRRRSEIGLRRALGAAAGNVRSQILIELAIIATFGILLGALLAVQFPLMGVFGSVSWFVYLTALAGSIVFMYAVVIAAAIYPSRIATQIQPIEALRYD